MIRPPFIELDCMRVQAQRLVLREHREGVSASQAKLCHLRRDLPFTVLAVWNVPKNIKVIRWCLP